MSLQTTKTRLCVVPHSVLVGHFVVELWHGARLIGTVVGADGPGIRVISKYPMSVESPGVAGAAAKSHDGRDVAAVEVKIEPK